MQLPQVMDGGVELPLAAAALEATHAEAVGALPVFHLPEHGFDRGPALAVEGAAALGAQLAIHALRAVMDRGIRPRGAGASRSAARCLRSFWVASKRRLCSECLIFTALKVSASAPLPAA